MHRIQPKPVEAVLAQPVQRISDGEVAHLRHAIVDGAAPGCLGVGKEGWRIAAEVISFRPEVIIHHVEKHHQPAQMGLIDQRLEIVGTPIAAVRRIPQHAVIAPIARAGEIRQRHQLQRGNPGRHQMIELADHGAVAAFRREGADMGLEQHRLLPRPSAPLGGAPAISAVIDHLARTRNIVGLKRGGRVGHVDFVIDAELVACAGLDAGYFGGKPAVFAAPHR